VLKVRIAGAGSYLPEARVTNAHFEAELGLRPGWIERATGVRERRRVSGETSSEMAAAAVRHALHHGGIEAHEVDLIIGASTAPQQAIPCTAVFVQRALDLAESGCPCFDINATCLSFYVALETAARLIDAGRSRCAVVYSSEITSGSLNYAEPESCVLFGDAAAAVVLTPTAAGEGSEIIDCRFRTDSRGAELTQLLGGGTLHHPNYPTTRPETNQFVMQGRPLFRMATRLFEPFLKEFLAELGWERRSIAAVVPHQASGHGVAMLWDHWGFQRDQVILNLGERGNCLAASTPLALVEAIHARRIRRGDRVLLAGTGAGLSLGLVALTY
jgi:3-oxoacyl-[acyl-carrier-protein] synthase III